MFKGHVGASIGLLYAILVVGLIAAKLAGHIHFTWWLVLMPLWLPALIVVVAVLLAIVAFSGSSSNGGNPFR